MSEVAAHEVGSADFLGSVMVGSSRTSDRTDRTLTAGAQANNGQVRVYSAARLGI